MSLQRLEELLTDWSQPSKWKQFFNYRRGKLVVETTAGMSLAPLALCPHLLTFPEQFQTSEICLPNDCWSIRFIQMSYQDNLAAFSEIEELVIAHVPELLGMIPNIPIAKHDSLEIENLARQMKELRGKAIAHERSGNAQIGILPPISKIACALAVLYEHPDWTNMKIAAVVGCAAETLSRSLEFKCARMAR